MVEVTHEWAGKERLFRLTTGDVFDLEEATGDGIGVIFTSLASSSFSLKHVYHTIRLALIGGGLDLVRVNGLMRDHFDTRPYLQHAALAGAVVADLMTGVEPQDDDQNGSDEPFRFSEVVQICRVFNMSPQDLRALRYSDFINMVRGFNAREGRKAPHLTEDEFEAILAKYEPEAG